MDYIHATLVLHETGREINEANLTAVLEASGTDVVESRVKAIVAALEGVDIEAIAPEPEFDTLDVTPEGTTPTGGAPEIAGADDEAIDAGDDHDSVVDEGERDERADDDDVQSEHDREDPKTESEFEFSSPDGSDRPEGGNENRPSRGDSDEGGAGAG